MGSVQQIVLGIVCLVAAFAFGNYVNNNPPLHQNADADSIVSADQVATAGNVKSRLPVGSLDLSEKRPAPIATMRQPLKSRFALPSQPADVFDSKTSNKSLPAPSQLANGRSTMPGPNDLGFAPVLESKTSGTKISDSSDVFRGPAKAIEVPDFSAIAAEFNSVPLLPAQLGSMPQHSPVDQSLGQIAKGNSLGGFDQGQSGRLQSQDPKSLDNLFDQFESRPIAANNSKPAQAVNVWDTQPTSSFNGEDFAPKLKDHLAATGTTFNSQPPAPTEATRQNELAQAAQPTYSNPNSIASNSVATKNDSMFESTPGPWANSKQSLAQSDSDLPNIPEPVTRGYRGDFEKNNSPNEGWGGRMGSLHTNSQSQVVNHQPNSGQRNPIQSAGSNSNIRSFGKKSPVENPFDNAPVFQPNNRVRTKLPFALTHEAKTEMAALRSRASSNIALESTRFVDHVVQRGETLQSISTRYFGKPDFYLDVYLANRNQLRNPAIVPAGTVLKVPIYE